MRARFLRIAAPLSLSIALSIALAASMAAAQQKRSRAPVNKGAAAAEEAKTVIAYAGVTVHTGANEIIENATVVVEGETIKAVGKDVTAPPGATVVNASGLVVTPGLVDPLTSLGLVEVALEPDTHDDQQKPNTNGVSAAFRTVDGFNPNSTLIDVARAGGLTSAGVIPHGGLIAGQSAWVDLDGALAQGAVARAPLAMHVQIDAGSAGHASAVLRLREAFDDARAFVKARAAWERNQSRPFAPSRLDLEALSGTLDQKMPVVFHVNRASSIMAALDVAKEFKLRAVIAGGAEAWKVAPALAAAKTPVIVFPLAQPDSFDTIGAREDNAALLHKAGVPVAISTGESHNARKLRQVAGNAVRAGLPHEAAIAAITRVPAEALGMADHYGTLAAGKTANLVLWSGDPLELGTDVRGVVIRGRPMPLTTRQSALLAKYRRLTR